MRHRLAALALIPLALAACGSGDATAPASPSPASSSARPQSWERIPETQCKEYVGALERVEPGLVVDEERALGRALNTCMDIEAGVTEKTVMERTRLRYTGGYVTVNTVQARRIVAAAKR
ncbi:MAG: hypothetical protein ACRDOO_19135 [Actinomadura sp.]